jgi:hypothetical protein
MEPTHSQLARGGGKPGNEKFVDKPSAESFGSGLAAQ